MERQRRSGGLVLREEMAGEGLVGLGAGTVRLGYGGPAGLGEGRSRHGRKAREVGNGARGGQEGSVLESRPLSSSSARPAADPRRAEGGMSLDGGELGCEVVQVLPDVPLPIVQRQVGGLLKRVLERLRHRLVVRVVVHLQVLVLDRP